MTVKNNLQECISSLAHWIASNYAYGPHSGCHWRGAHAALFEAGLIARLIEKSVFIATNVDRTESIPEKLVTLVNRHRPTADPSIPVEKFCPSAVSNTQVAGRWQDLIQRAQALIMDKLGLDLSKSASYHILHSLIMGVNHVYDVPSYVYDMVLGQLYDKLQSYIVCDNYDVEYSIFSSNRTLSNHVVRHTIGEDNMSFSMWTDEQLGDDEQIQICNDIQTATLGRLSQLHADEYGDPRLTWPLTADEKVQDWVSVGLKYGSFSGEPHNLPEAWRIHLGR